MSIMRLDTYLTVSGRSRQSILKTPHCAKAARKHPIHPTRQLLHKVGNLAISIVVSMATIATVIGAVSVTTAAQSEAASITPTSSAPSWSVQKSYPLAIDGLSDVSCVSTSFCMAAGGNSSGNGVVISYNGNTWKPYSLPSNVSNYSIYDFSCMSTSFCMALGEDNSSDNNAALSYNGSTWKIYPLPPEMSGGDSSFTGLSCSSASFCVAVGQDSSGDNAALSYNGSTWELNSLPSDIVSGQSYDIQNVSCAHSGFCMTLADDNNSADNYMVLSYQAGTWKELDYLSSPVYGYQNSALSCTSSSFCMVAGGYVAFNGSSNGPAEYIYGVAFLYNGSTWEQVTLPSGTGHLATISCTSSSFCMAVGDNPDNTDGIALSYQSGTWKENLLPFQPYVVSCTSSSFCVTVESGGCAPTYYGCNNSVASLYTYNGTTWRQASIPFGTTIYQTSCVPSSFCMAVGQNSFGNDVAFLYNGSTWKQASLPPYTGGLYAVSCVSANFCMVGGDNSSDVTISYQAGIWKRISLPSGATDPLSISCTSTSFCVGVGQTSGLGGGVVISYNGNTWKIDPIPSYTGPLHSVSCISPSFCMAVGTNYFNNGDTSTINDAVLSYNGNTWKEDPLPSSATGGLAAVSCTSASFCMAVSNYSLNGSVFALVYNGNSWEEDPLPSSATATSIDAISCTSTSFCMAVGSVHYGGVAMAFSYQGGTWTQDFLPSTISNEITTIPGLGLNQYLYGVSCSSPSFCMAVGATYTQAVILTTLKVVTITSVTPSSSPITGGGTVTISGTHFGSGTTVSFGQYTLSGSAVTVNSSSSITVRVPPVSSPGMVEISVTTPIGTSNDTGFVYVDTNLSYIPVTPFRIADTRCSTDPPPSFCASENLPQANKNLSSPLAGHSITIQVTGTGIGSDEITSGAQSVVATITAIANNNANNGYLSVYPAGAAPPTASSLNYTAAMTIPNLITATLGKGGAIDIFSSSSNVNITVDIEGYYVPSGSDTQTPANRFTPLPSPIRVLDTRCSTTPKPSYCAAENIPAVNQISAASPDGYIKLKVAGISSIPISATAISLVVTAAGSLSGGYLSVYPTLSSAAPPDTSNVNFHKAVASADSAIVEVGQSGYISIYNSANTPTNVIVDINGYFYSSGDGFSPSSPIRICDTRSQTTIGGKDVVSGLTGQCNNSGVPLDPSLSALLLDPITVQVTGIAGITSTAKVVVANITVVNTGGAGYLTAFPAGTTMPPTSNINWGKGQIMPNMVTAALSPKGQMEIYCSSSCDVVVDVVGWYS